MTVSRVINQPTRVALDTRARVEQSIHTLGFVPNALARSLLHGRTHTIALVVSDISNPFFTEIACGVEDVAQRNGYTVIFGNSDESREKERHYIQALVSRRIDGVLISAAGTASRPLLGMLARYKIPYVLLDRAVAGVHADLVVGDNMGGARTLTEHLITLGHRRIGLVSGPPAVPTAQDRRRGYADALRAHGIVPHPAWVRVGNFKRDGGYQAARQLLALPSDQMPTAIFADNNFHAIGVIEALRAARLAVPDDVAVVCFDDLELSSALDPFLTVMAQPARTFGTIAMQFLLDRLDSTYTSPPRTVVLPPKLVVRVSCGAYRTALVGAAVI